MTVRSAFRTATLRAVAAILLLSACQLSLPGKVREPAADNPITTGQISVTSLDASAPAGPSATAVSEPTTDAAPDQPALDQPAPDQPAPDQPAPDLQPPTGTAPPPPAPKSRSQIACEKGRGAWVAAGTTGTMSCQTPQRDGGQQCTRDSDCDGQCLARSQTCAPFAPLFGCNDVLQDNGQRVTLCIE